MNKKKKKRKRKLPKMEMSSHKVRNFTLAIFICLHRKSAVLSAIEWFESPDLDVNRHI